MIWIKLLISMQGFECTRSHNSLADASESIVKEENQVDFADLRLTLFLDWLNFMDQRC